MGDEYQNGWSKAEMFVIKELERLNENVESALSMKQEVAILKEKMVWIGAIWGFVSSLIVPLAQWIIDAFKH